MITFFPGIPYAPHVKVAVYDGIGSCVLKPGTIVKKDGYTDPSSIYGTTTDVSLKDVYIVLGDK